MLTILFFLQGFTYGLLDALNSHFQTTLNITASKPSGLQASYFGTYFICPLTVSDWIARKYGFRVTFMTGKKHKVASNDPIVSPADLSICESGLAVFAIGYLLFWPSGVKKSFSGFAVVGAGAGTFVVPLLASRVFFANTVDDNAGLRYVQWTYLVVAGFVTLLIILFWLAPFPEITDAETKKHWKRRYPSTAKTLSRSKSSIICSSACGVSSAMWEHKWPWRLFQRLQGSWQYLAESSDLLVIAQGLYAFISWLLA
ncbi:uncharacterized protein N7525_003136 [Penicillium rubens]|uniref:uncharacterized protein n=1 Tax=Penicillium rubens TaxID=1108849 RepID=UPI002A5AFBE6|nr:uncharacterized protein N7525_003136 [Penicillium rubens]KAJ5837948.1 hypothetical protein N7525_003136 [Penicillium rubens]KAJ5865995.1 hypothetical protein N7534_000548 [Penicillium rubens]